MNDHETLNLRGIRKSIWCNSNGDLCLAYARSQKLGSPGAERREVRRATSDHHWTVGGHPVSDHRYDFNGKITTNL